MRFIHSEFPCSNRNLCVLIPQEYILNRGTESEIQGWTIKCSVIQTLVDTQSTTRQVFGDPYFMKLRAYTLEGVFYSPTETEVATMEL